MKTYDAIIIGGGPAGLSAGIYLARLCRSALIIDHSRGRLNYFQTNENYLGFPKGITARNLLKNGEKQARNFGVEFLDDEVVDIKKMKMGFSVTTRNSKQKAKTIIFASGVKDRHPAFKNVEKYVGKSLFWCILCDAYKVRNKRVVVLGHDDASVLTCLELLNFTSKVTLLTNSLPDGDHISEKAKLRLKKARIGLKHGSIAKVKGKSGVFESIELDTGEIINLDYMFNKQGYIPRSDLAASLGAVLEGEGFIKVDENQETSVKGVYAAGDVTHNSMHQIVAAANQGSAAAVSIHRALLNPSQKTI